jgi:cytochrome c peroxidase
MSLQRSIAMHDTNPPLCLARALALLLAMSAPAGADPGDSMPGMVLFPNPSGFAATYSTTGHIDLTGPFFQSLGTNGRACVTCHQPSQGWTVTPSQLQARFEATAGTDPIFRPVDGANSPNADVSSVDARRAAYSQLLTKAVIRVGIGIPDNAEFDLAAVDDPYGYASARELSLFRRVLPSTNLGFLSTVMWDGRETLRDAASQACVLGTTNCFAAIHVDLAQQANDATTGHAQGQPLQDAQKDAIAAFESSLYTAQVIDFKAGGLASRHASGGPQALAGMPFYFGMNDAVSGDYRTGGLFNPNVFGLYDTWDNWEKIGIHQGEDIRMLAARNAIVRGQTLFNSKPIRITGVGGLNDDLSVPVLQGTCSTCHDTPGAGNHSIPAPLNIGIADASRRTPDMPLYTLRNKATGETVQTTDPGRALVTGKWKDIGRFKGPTLRALATRAPYFHDGMAADLDAVVDFYNDRFDIGFTPQEKADLVAFLKAL